ncbi:MAG: hypothetical protein M1838_005011 [Thelocarpon superellum]|nr:MAG: hypothetical protein M1838_005011 [Thelocarpon superellum]
MDQLGRPSSFLPSIKCSGCNAEIEISRMGDHICSGAGNVVETPNARPWASNGPKQPARGRDEHGAGLDFDFDYQPPRPPFARGNGSRSRSRSKSRTRGESNGSHGHAGHDSRGHPFRAPPRSNTAPPLRPARPPSLELSNLDCAFPPFPMANSPARSTPTDAGTPDSTKGHSFFGADAVQKSTSPRSTGGGSVMSRMNNIVPGPFDTNTTQATEPESRSRSAAGHRLPRDANAGSRKEFANFPNASGSRPPVPRPSTSGSERPFGASGADNWVTQKPRSRSRAPTRGADTMSSKSDASTRGRSVEPRTDTSRDQSFQESFRLEDEAETFPFNNTSPPPSEVSSVLPLPRSDSPEDIYPSHPNHTKRFDSAPPTPDVPFMNTPRPDTPPSIASNRHDPPSSFPATTSTPDPFARKPYVPLRSGSGGSGPHDDAPPRPARPWEPVDYGTKPNAVKASLAARTQLADEWGVGNPYHTPTESQSSNGSGYGSDAKTGSSRSTPPLLDHPENLHRLPLTSDYPLSPAEDRARPFEAPRAEFGPAVDVRDSPRAASKPQLPKAKRVPTPDLNVDAFNNLVGHVNPIKPASADSVKARSQPSARRPAQAPRRRATTSKGTCKGCGEGIIGKSVSSADGRLTGRYHKPCFVCRTCKAPFETATFYVIEDHPYCEQHYHQLNNSLCQACDRGIEGQYLETEQTQKYHPHCFSCQDCGGPLRDGYFEMNGRAYCETHATRRAQQTAFLGPGPRNPERRTTRMMMMV